MASTDLMAYLNYMATWDSESDANIDSIIKEQNLFLNVGDYDSDTAVNNEFNTLNDLACEVRNLTIAADATQIAADAAAVASIWSFGMGMAAYAALEATEIIERKVISSKSKKLNDKLTDADADISASISSNVKDYVAKYKENNNLIVSKAPVGLDTKTCRSYLMQFTADVQRRTGKLDAATFKKWAESARLLFNSDEINKVYDALDKLNMSAKTDADVKQFMDVLAGFTPPQGVAIAKDLLMGVSILIMFRKLQIANKSIKLAAEEAGIPLEEVNTSAFEKMDAVGKFVTVVAVIMSVTDIVFNILDIVDVVKQCNKMCDQLQGPIKQSYLDYFNGIKEASKQYNAAINPSPLQNNWIKKDNVAQYQEASWDGLIAKIPSTTVEAAKQYADANPKITFFFYCRAYMNLGSKGIFNPGDAVFFSGGPWYGSAPQCDAYEKSK